MNRKKYIGLALSCVEWYDFAVYASLASMLGKLFFNVHDPLLNLLYSFTTFAIAYITRPLGSSIFGYLAVRTHNDISIQYSLLFMSIATIGIGILPTSASFSVICVILLCACRLLQGLAMGGCYGASYFYVSQHAKKTHKNRATAFVCTGFLLGFILGNSTIGVIEYYLSTADMMLYGWRIPFLLGGFLSFIVYCLTKLTGNNHSIELPHSDTCIVNAQSHMRNILNILKCVMVIGLDMIGFYLFFVFNPQYLLSVNYLTPEMVSLYTTSSLIILAALVWLFSFLADKWNNISILTISALCLACAGLRFPWVTPFDYFLCLLMLGACYGALPNWVIKQFHGRYVNYYTGLSFNLASTVFAGTTPVIATLLLRYDLYTLRFTITCIGSIILLILYINLLMTRKAKIY